jgi:hypothetical protein
MGESLTQGIAQFIPQYPDRSEDDLAYKLARKKEFYDLRLEPAIETLPEGSPTGTPYKHQLLNARFISPHTDYKSVLVFHDPGLGKTLTGCFIVEQFKNVPVDGDPRKPAIILVPNEAIQKYWINQIVNVCTKDIYNPEFGEEEEETEGKRKGRTKKNVWRTYYIETYDKFLKSLPRSSERVRQEYSNRIIIIDEAHSLRINKKGTDKKDKKAEEENKKRYELCYKFLHTVENCRVVLLSATPIWDQTFEIASLMNLILPKEDRLPSGQKFMNKYFTEDGKLKHGRAMDELRRLFLGRISYLRIKLPIKVEEMGSAKPWLNFIKVYPDAMSEEQADASKRAKAKVEIRETTIKKDGVTVKYKYDWAKNDFIRDEKGELIPDSHGKPFSIPYKIEGGPLIRSARQACILVAPILDKRDQVTGVSFDEKYFEKYFENKRPRYSFGKTPRDNALSKLFKNNLWTYSTKYASIIELLKNNPTEKAFIYNRFVTEIGGILPFAMILQLHGFVWVTSPGEMKRVDKKVRKFIVISSKTETSKDTTAALIDAFNHKDNAYGDMCQFIIGSQKMAVGLTLSCIRQIHFVSPWWNIPSLIQAFGRGYRLGSHKFLPEDERYINLYRHVAVDSSDKKDGVKIKQGFPPGVYFSREDTIDIYMYRVSQRKEFSNSEIYRFMKEVSWDCPLSYNRNVLTTDEDYSRQCDYRECEYDCYGVPIFDFSEEIAEMSSRQLKKECTRYGIRTKNKADEELREEIEKVWKYRIPKDEITYDAYNKYYSSHIVSGLITEVIEQFRKYFSLSLESLMTFMTVVEEDKESLLQALDYIIDMHIPIRDRYGFDSYLQEYNNVYFLSTNTSVASYLEGNYTSDPLVTERTSLGDIVKSIHFEKDARLIKTFCEHPIKEKAILDQMNCHTFIILLEAAYEIKEKKEKEGEELTKREEEAIQVMAKYNKKFLHLISYEKEEDVVHVLYQVDITKSKCDLSNKALKADGSMRIYDKKQNKWKFLDDPMKEEEYINIIKTEKKEKAMDVWEGNPYGIYGLYKTNNKGESKFAIRRKSEGGEGRVCGTLPKPEVIKIFFQIEYFPNPKPEENRDSRQTCLTRIRNSLMKNLLEQRGIDLSSKRLKKFSTKSIQGIDWLMHSAGVRTEMCPMLQEWFETHKDDNDEYLFKS